MLRRLKLWLHRDQLRRWLFGNSRAVPSTVPPLRMRVRKESPLSSKARSTRSWWRVRLGSSQGISGLEKRVASLEAALKKAKSKAHKRKKKNKKLAARVKELEGAGPGSGSSVAAKSPGTLATVMENPEAEDAEVSESHAKEMDNPDASTADAE